MLWAVLLAYLGLAACLLFSSKLREYGPLIWTLSSGIIFTTLGCEWLYAIHEEYGYLALRNICFQVLSLILLLTYVKDESDLLLYAWTTVAGSARANFINFLRLRKYCTWSFTWRFSWQKHLLPILVLFANSLVDLLYVRADVAQLGVMTSDYYVGLYLVASKVTALLKQFVRCCDRCDRAASGLLIWAKGRRIFSKIGPAHRGFRFRAGCRGGAGNLACRLGDLSGLLLFGEKVGPPLAQREKAGQQFAGLSLCLLGLPSCFS